MAHAPDIDTGIKVLRMDSDDEDGHGDTINYEDNDSFYDGSDADEDMDEDDAENPQAGGRSQKRPRSASPQGGESSKRARLNVPRKDTRTVRAEHKEAADNKIWELKQQGKNDDEIATQLEQENFGKMKGKTVGTRFVRLRKKKDEEEYQRLDDELSDWHVGEDEILHDCRNAVEKKIELEIARLQEKKWQEVAVRFADRIRQKKYTGKACKERFEGLLNGTALLPIELDSDQEGRAEIRKTRIAAAKRARVKAAEIVKRAEAEKHRKSQEERDRKVRRWQEQQQEKREKEAFKAEEERIRAEKAAGKAKIKAQRDAALQRAREEVIEKKKTAEAENRLFHHYTGQWFKRMPANKRKAKDDHGEEEESVEDSGSDLEAGTKGAGAAGNAKPTIRHTIKEKAPKVTKETLLNPRSVMNDEELGIILSTRGLLPRKPNESHPQIVARLAAADKALGSGILNSFLKERFKSIRGKHEERVRRLQESEAEDSVAGQIGAKSTSLEFKQSYEGYSGEYAGLIGDD